MKFLFDILPVALFFGAFRIAEGRPEAAAGLLDRIFGQLGLNGAVDARQAPILIATLVVIVATAVQIGWVWWRHGKVDKMLWVSLILVVVLGGLTLWLRDDRFIKWKPTLLYWAFSSTLLFSALVLKKNLMRSLLSEQIILPERVWTGLNFAWAGFFAFLGAANLLVAFAFGLSTEDWVNFKLFGAMGLMFVFVIAQGLVLSRHMDESSGESS